MVMHRNTGAPFLREDGSRWERGQDAEPTQAELRTFRYKLKPIMPAERLTAHPPEKQEEEEEESAAVDEEEWPLVMTPETYERLHPKGRYADLARRLMAPKHLPST